MSAFLTNMSWLFYFNIPSAALGHLGMTADTTTARTSQSVRRAAALDKTTESWGHMCYCSSTYTIPVILPKGQVAGYS